MMVNPSRIKEFNNGFYDPIQNFGNPFLIVLALHNCIEEMPKISADGEA